jgi:hypothetical protein
MTPASERRLSADKVFEASQILGDLPPNIVPALE